MGAMTDNTVSPKDDLSTVGLYIGDTITVSYLQLPYKSIWAAVTYLETLQNVNLFQQSAGTCGNSGNKIAEVRVSPLRLLFLKLVCISCSQTSNVYTYLLLAEGHVLTSYKRAVN